MILPPVLVAFWLGGLWWTVLILLAAILGSYELFSMLAQGNYRPASWIGYPWVVALVLSFSPLLAAVPLSFLIYAGIIAVFIYAMYQTEKPLATWVSTSTGVIYLGVLLGHVLGLRLLPGGFWWVTLAALVTWGNDTVAYFVGVTVGKHKMWPRLSPKKSWEGTVGGWIGAGLIGAGIGHFSPLALGWQTGAFIGMACGVLALYGDLSISLVKRQVGAKDSGRLFPGHGGMLDRLDSLLFVFPFVYHIVLLIG
jgi:phosphatidate cytidylyltransferase